MFILPVKSSRFSQGGAAPAAVFGAKLPGCGGATCDGAAAVPPGAGMRGAPALTPPGVQNAAGLPDSAIIGD